MKRKTGTREWADSNFNIGIGCAHDCLYCYAKSAAIRFKQISSLDEWTKEKIKDKIPAITKKQGWIMFPTTHDITPYYLPAATDALLLLLEKGNNVLIVSKPHLECIGHLCKSLKNFKEQILFRFTIGTSCEETAKFWEPGAPTIQARLACLFFTYKAGYATSISMEPMLGTVEETVELFNRMAPCVTDKIWIGKMNKIDSRVQIVDKKTEDECERIRSFQTDEKILWLVDQLKNHPKIAWKDSIKEIIEAHELH